MVQGFGKVGYWAARSCHEAGAVIVGIAEHDGAIADASGLDPEAVQRHRTATGSILGCPGATTLADTRAALELPCDVLVPAALEHQITEENAPRIQARIVLEGANGPTTPEADAILADKGVLVIPDIYANAGGVIVSYFEWLKNLSHIGFGRIEKRYQESTYSRILGAIETATGDRFTPDQRATVIRGPDELTVVNSGLEEIMFRRLPRDPRDPRPPPRDGLAAHRGHGQRHREGRPVLPVAGRVSLIARSNRGAGGAVASGLVALAGVLLPEPYPAIARGWPARDPGT